jgi:succinate dehydrogenase / fumarate reductase membrane anchor subunit
MVKRVVVGAHYGTGDWLVQRLTAVLMVLYTLVFLGILLVNGGFDEASWRSLFASGAFRVITFLFLLSVFWHAWVGMRDILMDYVKPVGVRLALQASVVAGLVLYAGWAIQLLWGAR